MKKEQYQKRLLSYFLDKEEHSKEYYQEVNEDFWTLSDLIIRQYKNNGANGFGMVKIQEAYLFVKENKEQLIAYNMISKEGYNNAGIKLWSDYKI